MFVSAAAWPQPLRYGFALSKRSKIPRLVLRISTVRRSQFEKDTAGKASHTARDAAKPPQINKGFQEVRILAEIRWYGWILIKQIG